MKGRQVSNATADEAGTRRKPGEGKEDLKMRLYSGDDNDLGLAW